MFPEYFVRFNAILALGRFIYIYETTLAVCGEYRFVYLCKNIPVKPAGSGARRLKNENLLADHERIDLARPQSSKRFLGFF
jgi:hypothetical protein